MSKKNKFMKKLSACALAIALAVTAVHWPEVQAEEGSGFDANNIVMKFGVLSDLHLMNGSKADGDVDFEGAQKAYESAVQWLATQTDKELDMLVLGGDYGNEGNETQATKFATETKKNLSSAFGENVPPIIMTYGNHDTEWKDAISYDAWENILNANGVLDGVEYGPTGCYKQVVTKGDKNYYFFSIETEHYANNLFLVEALEWLDVELGNATTENPNNYVYVVSHAPIMESGVYGANPDFSTDAYWASARSGNTGKASDGTERATSSDIHKVLKKYPQVVYFSGHTHMTNTLESSIMMKDYTAITVASLKGGDLFGSNSDKRATNYLDVDMEGTNPSKPGYFLYVEVDAKGNQRVQRVKAAGDYTWTTEDITAWDMSAPTLDGAHLDQYSAESRAKAPTFADGAALTIDAAEVTANMDGLALTYSFDTATCDNHIIRYELTLYDQNDKVIANKWMLGDWTDHTTGVVTGTNHMDATKLSYTFTCTNAELNGVTDITAQLTAIDEFGAESEPLEAVVLSNTFFKPVNTDANKNLFDGLKEDRIHYVGSSAYTESPIQVTMNDSEDRIGTLSFDNTEHVTDTVVAYMLDPDVAKSDLKNKTAKYAFLGPNADQLSTLEADDTFVYETTFKATNRIHIVFRALKVENWTSAYSGIDIQKTCTKLQLNNADYGQVNTSYCDNQEHTLIVVSSEDKVLVWIDGALIFNCSYDAKDKITGTGTTEDPYKFPGDIALTDITMYPAFAVHAAAGGSATTFTVSDPKLYLYDAKEQVADEMGATEAVSKNYWQQSNVTVTEGYTAETTATGFTAGTTATNGNINSNIQNALNRKDTITVSFNYKMTEKANDSCLDVYVGNTYTKGNLRITLNTNAAILQYSNLGSYNMAHYWQTEVWTSNNLKEPLREANVTRTVKIIMTPTDISVYLDGVALWKNQAYPAEFIGEANYTPRCEFKLNNVAMTVDNIVISKADEQLEGVTPLSNYNNLITGKAGDLQSSVSFDSSAVNGSNIYSDTTWRNHHENDSTSYNWGQRIHFFGKSNVNHKIKGNESIVVSTLARVSNDTLTRTEDSSGNPLSEEAYATYVSRLVSELAKYDGKSAWYYIQGTTLSVTDGADTWKSVNLSTEVGYAIGEYIRLTNVISPFGFDIYANGKLVVSWAIGNGSNVGYTANFGAQGAEVRFLDCSLHYTYENGDAYYEALSNDIAKYDSVQGVYFSDVDKARVENVRSAVAAYTQGGTNELLKAHVGVIDEVLSSGMAYNNMVYDGNTAIGNSQSVTNSGNYQWISVFTEDNIPEFKQGETWFFEADISCTANVENPRTGFSMRVQQEPDVMIQNGNELFWNSANSDFGWGDYNSNGTLKEGAKWHVKYIVKPYESIEASITSGGVEIHNISKDWATVYGSGTITFHPRFYFWHGDFEINNIYVGCDAKTALAKNLNAVDAAIAGTEYTLASILKVEASLAEIEAVLNAENGTAEAYDAANIALIKAKNKMKAATAQLTVGTEADGTNSVAFGIAKGEALPTEYLVIPDGDSTNDDKYVISWEKGETEATIYLGTDTYTPDYIDLDMLNVGVQEHKTDSATRRFIGSVNDVDKYSAVGFVFSLTEEEPELGKTDCYGLGDMTTVYNTILEDSVAKDGNALYGTSYSQYLFAKPLDFGSHTKIYVRAYVKLAADDTPVYGAAKVVELPASAE